MRNLMKIFGLLLITIGLSFTNPGTKTIIIDVGHGGKDIGTTYDGFTEKEIVLSIGNKVKELSKNDNIEIILTRSADEFVSLEERTEFINSLNADFLISIHANAHRSNPSKNGFEIFTSNNGKMPEQSAELAEKFKNTLSKDFTVADIKSANFHILKNSNLPSTLIEMGFLTNENDREMLTSETGQEKIAQIIVQALRE